MKNKGNNTIRRMPLWLSYIMDVLLFVVMLLVFCYFHHVRILWGIQKAPEIIDKIEQTTESEGSEITSPAEHLIHDWTTVSVIQPTCIEGGYTEYRCQICGFIKNDDWIPATGHTPAEAVGVKDATAEESGYTGDIYCSVCGVLLEKGRESPPTGHKNTQLINIVEATCTDKGYSGDVYCPECNKIVAMGTDTPVLNHEYEMAEVISPTCFTEGYTLNRCVHCSATAKTEFKAIIPHSMGNDGKCVYCGKMMLDTSGDYGVSFPEKFIQGATNISLSSESDILSYASENGISLKQSPDTKYISLYRSHDIFLTVSETNTRLYYAGTGKTYTVQYYIYDIYIRNLSNFSTSYSVTQREPMADLIQETEASKGNVVAAVNGDYMGNTNYCKVCVRNGDVYRKAGTVSGDVCVLFFDGTMKTYLRNDYNWSEIEAGRPYQVWNFGPALINSDGQAITDYTSLDDYVVNNRHPRTAIGCFEPGHYAFIEVDGRSTDSEGVRIVQLAELFVELGCKVAYNMDGGASAQAWVGNTAIREEPDNGDNQRNLWDIICISENS